MTKRSKRHRAWHATAFTLIELLVVVAIIAILAATFIVSVGAVRNSVRRVETQARLDAVETGIETYRRATGAPYPPSRSDWPRTGKFASSPFTMSENLDTDIGAGGGGIGALGEYEYREVSGASLLMWALVGADLLGTPGFRDLDGDGDWFDDTHDIPWLDRGGLYALSNDDDHQPMYRRHAPFLDINAAEIVTIRQLREDVLKGKQAEDAMISSFDKVMLDGFGYPILYYRANVHAKRMTSTEEYTGIYDPRDNSRFTGGYPGLTDTGGVDLGAGASHLMMSRTTIAGGMHVDLDIDSDPSVSDLSHRKFDGSFAKFIWNRNISVRNEPVNRDSFLLISPGADALWGTRDDVTNFPGSS